MLDRQLHAALSAFAEEAAWELAAETADGAEVPFEVVESSGGRRRDTPLYCYRPLTAAFIEERVSILGRLPTYLAAVHALAGCSGLDAYLVARGESRIPREPRARAEEALRLFLARVFEDTTDFVLVPERLSRAYAELEAAALEGRAVVEVVAPLRGIAIASSDVALGDGLALVRGDRATDLPPAVTAPRDDGLVPVAAVLRWETAPGDDAVLPRAQARLRRLVTALRLYDTAIVTPGRTGWARTGGGTWTPFALVAGGMSRGTLALPPAQEDELRGFLSLVARRTPRAGEVAWALRRFELACERPTAGEALTDVLLALRALLEPEGVQSARLAGRVAAVCALPEVRATVAERVAHAVALERSVVAGMAPEDDALRPLVDEVTGWLRALLRDVLCGHLDSDLRSVADALLAEVTA